MPGGRYYASTKARTIRLVRETPASTRKQPELAVSTSREATSAMETGEGP
jgi:hypothetical protein